MNKTRSFRLPYTREEREKIVNYVVKHKKYGYLTGNNFWKHMEENKIVDRPWQSIKEHFRKRIIFEIDSYNISEIDVILIRRSMMKDSWTKRFSYVTIYNAPVIEDNSPKEHCYNLRQPEEHITDHIVISDDENQLLNNNTMSSENETLTSSDIKGRTIDLLNKSVAYRLNNYRTICGINDSKDLSTSEASSENSWIRKNEMTNNDKKKEIKTYAHINKEHLSQNTTIKLTENKNQSKDKICYTVNEKTINIERNENMSVDILEEKQNKNENRKINTVCVEPKIVNSSHEIKIIYDNDSSHRSVEQKSFHKSKECLKPIHNEEISFLDKQEEKSFCKNKTLDNVLLSLSLSEPNNKVENVKEIPPNIPNTSKDNITNAISVNIIENFSDSCIIIEDDTDFQKEERYNTVITKGSLKEKCKLSLKTQNNLFSYFQSKENLFDKRKDISIFEEFNRLYHNTNSAHELQRRFLNKVNKILLKYLRNKNSEFTDFEIYKEIYGIRSFLTVILNNNFHIIIFNHNNIEDIKKIVKIYKFRKENIHVINDKYVFNIRCIIEKKILILNSFMNFDSFILNTDILQNNLQRIIENFTNDKATNGSFDTCNYEKNKFVDIDTIDSTSNSKQMESVNLESMSCDATNKNLAITSQDSNRTFKLQSLKTDIDFVLSQQIPNIQKKIQSCNSYYQNVIESQTSNYQVLQINEKNNNFLIHEAKNSSNITTSISNNKNLRSHEGILHPKKDVINVMERNSQSSLVKLILNENIMKNPTAKEIITSTIKHDDTTKPITMNKSEKHNSLFYTYTEVSTSNNMIEEELQILKNIQKKERIKSQASTSCKKICFSSNTNMLARSSDISINHSTEILDLNKTTTRNNVQKSNIKLSAEYRCNIPIKETILSQKQTCIKLDDNTKIDLTQLNKNAKENNKNSNNLEQIPVNNSIRTSNKSDVINNLSQISDTDILRYKIIRKSQEILNNSGKEQVTIDTKIFDKNMTNDSNLIQILNDESFGNFPYTDIIHDDSKQTYDNSNTLYILSSGESNLENSLSGDPKTNTLNFVASNSPEILSSNIIKTNAGTQETISSFNFNPVSYSTPKIIYSKLTEKENILYSCEKENSNNSCSSGEISIQPNLKIHTVIHKPSQNNKSESNSSNSFTKILSEIDKKINDSDSDDSHSLIEMPSNQIFETNKFSQNVITNSMILTENELFLSGESYYHTCEEYLQK